MSALRWLCWTSTGGGRETGGPLEGVRDAAKGVDCDITDPDDCAVRSKRSLPIWGPTVLINNAGLTHRSAFADTDLEVYRRVMEVNYFGALH